jgi:hypothetical protein
MARTDDIVTAFLAAHGTRFLSTGKAVPLDRMRRMFPTDQAFSSRKLRATRMCAFRRCPRAQCLSFARPRGPETSVSCVT